MGAKWTVMTYMAGNNNLSDAAGEDLEEMHQVGSTDDVKAVCFMKQLNQSSAYYIEVGPKGGKDKRKKVGNLDSGDPQTVIDFVRWAVETAPAGRYALVLWNHGGGWAPDDLDQMYSQPRGGRRGARRGGGVNRRELNRRANQSLARLVFTPAVSEILGQPSEGERQICNDDGTGHSLDTIELRKVLEQTKKVIGGPLAVLGMDACLMSTLEVAYETSKLSDVVVGSEDLEPGAGWPYQLLLGDLTKNPDMDAHDFGKVVVDRYIESYRELEDQWPVTQCATDTARVGEFAGTIDALAKALRKSVKTGWPEVVKARSKSADFQGHLCDLRMFARYLQSSKLDDGVKKAAQELRKSLKPGGYVIAEGHLGDRVKDCGGITAYFPPPTEHVSEYYKDLKFAKDNAWDEFLLALRKAVRG